MAKYESKDKTRKVLAVRSDGSPIELDFSKGPITVAPDDLHVLAGLIASGDVTEAKPKGGKQDATGS